MSESLQEYVHSGQQQLRVDREAGIIRGVKLLGLASRNGRRYRESALEGAVSLYEEAKVNINHPKGHPLSPRDYQDRLGVVRGVEFRAGEGLFGELHFNPKHALSEQLVWDAEHAPQNVGMSHNVLARTSRSGDDTVVEAITKVQSIDLVADPATTSGLFEQESQTAAVSWDQLTLEQLELHRPDLRAELQAHHSTELVELRTKLEAAEAREAVRVRRGRIVELLEEHQLPLPDRTGGSQIVSDAFVETLLTAKDDAALERLVEQRAKLVHAASRWTSGHHRPVAREQSPGTARSMHINARDFAAAISSR
jgi:hypothetical protein